MSVCLEWLSVGLCECLLAHIYLNVGACALCTRGVSMGLWAHVSVSDVVFVSGGVPRWEDCKRGSRERERGSGIHLGQYLCLCQRKWKRMCVCAVCVCG